MYILRYEYEIQTSTMKKGKLHRDMLERICWIFYIYTELNENHDDSDSASLQSNDYETVNETSS